MLKKAHGINLPTNHTLGKRSWGHEEKDVGQRLEKMRRRKDRDGKIATAMNHRVEGGDDDPCLQVDSKLPRGSCKQPGPPRSKKLSIKTIESFFRKKLSAEKPIVFFFRGKFAEKMNNR